MENISMVKMSPNGQIVIPFEMRKKFNKGDDLVLINKNEKIILEKAESLSEKQKEDLEFSRRTEEAWKSYDRGEFVTMDGEDFLKELEKW